MINFPPSRLRLLMLLSLFVVVFSVPTPHAGAQSDTCDDLVDLHGVDDPETLRAAIEQAESETGIDFHVFATDTLAAGQDLAAASFANCAGSYIVPGEVVDDTVVLAVAVQDRDFAVVYGENLNSRLDDDVDAIFERMAAWFQNDDFGAGLAAGVDEAADGLATEPTNVVGWVAAGAGGAAALGGGGAAIIGVRRKKKREREEAALEYDQISSQVTDVQARWYDAEEQASLLGGRLTGSSMERLEAAQLEAAVASSRLYDAWSPVSDLDGALVAALDEDPRVEAFRHINKAAVIAQENAVALQSFETVLAELDGAVDDLATLHRATSERINAGRQAAVLRANEGWDVSAADQRLDNLYKALGHIDALALRIDADTTRPSLEPLSAEAESLASDLEQLDQRRDEAATLRDTVATEAGGQSQRLGLSRKMIDDWRPAHAAASFHEALTYPDEAAKQLERARLHLREAESVGDIPRNIGVLREVNADINAADTAIDLADELLDNLDALDVELTAALREAPAAVTEARHDLQRLDAYVSSYQKELSPAAKELVRQVSSDLAEAEAALVQSPPNSLLAFDLSEDIAEEVEANLVRLRVEVETERLHSAASSNLRAAKTAIELADRHVASHAFSGRQDTDMREQLDRYRSEFNQLLGQVSTNPEHVSASAKAMTFAVEQLYEDAQRRQRTSRARSRNSASGAQAAADLLSVLAAMSSNGSRSTSRSRSPSRSRSSSRTRSRSRSKPARSKSRSSSRRSGGFKGGRSGKF